MTRVLTNPQLTRWLGPGGWLVLGILIVARVLIEPLRDLPKFDDKGMDAFSAVETYRLRKVPEPFEVGIFGSSVAVWGIVTGELAAGMGRDPNDLRLLAVEGGSTFDLWNLIRRNEDKYDHMKLALIEINPRQLNQNLEGDPRLHLDISQHATHAEITTLRHRSDRMFYYGDEILPLMSFRRPLRSFYLNITDPPPGDPVCPGIHGRTIPFDWEVPDPGSAVFHLKNNTTPITAAKRIAAYWKPSKLMDLSLKHALAWLDARSVRVIFYQMPVHPEVARLIREEERCREGYALYKTHLQEIKVTPDRFIETFSISDIGIPEKGLRDHTHLNQLGANIYSRHLGQQVRVFLEQP